MFERSTTVAVDPCALLVDLGPAGFADLAATHRQAVIRAANHEYVIAAAWADLHPGDPAAPRRGRAAMLVERSIRVGGDGTPEIAEGCLDELAQVRGTGIGAARDLVAAALDLRERLPLLWVKVWTGGMPGWQARRIAEATRHLSYEAARRVDADLAEPAGLLPWGRLAPLLDAAILTADPDTAARLAEQAAGTVGVWSGRTDQRGLRSVYARIGAGEAAWFLGVVERLADILDDEGDHRSADQRRATAFSILGQPGLACAMLARHADQTEREASFGAEPEPPSDHLDDQLALWDGQVDPPVDADQACVAEWTETGDPAEHPDFAPPADPADEPNCTCDRRHDRDARLAMHLPAGFDVKEVRPRVVLHFHLSEAGLRADDGFALVRPEHGDPIMLRELTRWLAETGCRVSVQPVIDPAATPPVDGYEIPDHLRHAVRYRDLADIAPWATSTARGLDLDHVIPYRTDGPPGQTAYANLAPVGRRAHRGKTRGWRHLRQPDPGTFLWRTRHGHLAVVTNHGTLNLGHTPFTEALWKLAATHAALSA